MTKQLLIANYDEIEKKRKVLKALHCYLINTGGDPKHIKEIGKKLTALTLNQAWILVDLENYK